VEEESGLTLRLFHGPPWGDRWGRPLRNSVLIFTYDTVRRSHDWNSEHEGHLPESPGKAPTVRERLNWRWIGEVSGIVVLVEMARTSTSVLASLTRCLTRMASFDNSVNGRTNVLSFNLFPSLFISASNLWAMGYLNRESRESGIGHILPDPLRIDDYYRRTIPLADPGVELLQKYLEVCDSASVSKSRPFVEYPADRGESDGTQVEQQHGENNQAEQDSKEVVHIARGIWEVGVPFLYLYRAWPPPKFSTD